MVATPDLGSGAERRGGSSPFIRTVCENSSAGRAQPCQGWGRGFESRFSLHAALVVELVDTQDLKSCASFGVRVQVPPGVHRKPDNHLIVRFFCFYQAQHGHNTLKINEGSIAKLGGYAKSLVNLNRKKVLSFTPRSCSLKFLIFALKDSAAALVLLASK